MLEPVSGMGAAGAFVAKPGASGGVGGGDAMQPDTGGGVGGGDAMQPDAGGSSVSLTEPNPCVIWKSVHSSDSGPPEGAVLGGLETTVGPPAMQYVCRAKPPGLAYSVPGKVIFGLFCYVAYRTPDGTMADYTASSSDPIEVLTVRSGCSFSWQTASNVTLPSKALDLGDPLGGGHYACHGYYMSSLSSGMQIGNVLVSADQPSQNECWFESFVGPSQPQDAMHFEVLAQDMP
jgi:hypothetical protein